MKLGPVIAMLAMILVGMGLVLQPAIKKTPYDYTVHIGSMELSVQHTPTGFVFTAPPDLAALGELAPEAYEKVIREQVDAWNARPKLERTMLGFFKITSWWNFGWIAIGLLGQSAFFGRMMVQWIISEKQRESIVPAVFWWMSLVGGLCLFTYFVWRVEFIGVLGQSTGIVIYVRNLRLIHKQKRRLARQTTESVTETKTAQE